MSRRTTGASLIFVSAMLFATRYLSAAIFGSSITTWNRDLFHAMLDSVGRDLVKWSILAFVFGIVYLVWAEIEVVKASHSLPGRIDKD